MFRSPLVRCLLLPVAVGATACQRAHAAPPAAKPAANARGPAVSPLRPQSERGTVPPSPGIANYEIQARLDAQTHRVEATSVLRWHNRSQRPVQSIPMHLYLNGFRAEDTAWMADGRLSGRTAAQGGEHPWGYIDVHAVTQGEDPQTAVDVPFAERAEPSLMDVKLAHPLPAGGAVTLRFVYTVQLPRVFARSGYAGDFHMVAQWFPKPGVLDRDGQWHTHPFTFHSEFYADFGDYTVVLDVPASMIVGATGAEQHRETDGGRKQVTYAAQMVHDFAWVAAEGLLEQTREVDGIAIRQLIGPDHVQDGAAHLDIAAATLEHMQARFGQYPWSTLTIVHPPTGASGAGGMEYPTLFTSSIRRRMPAWLTALGFAERFSGLYVTTHELGHQWFQGLLASNEFAQPWLDEGLNSYANLMVYFDHFADEAIAGEDVWVAKLAGHPVTLGDGLRLQERWRAANADISDQSAAEFSPLFGEYGLVTYRRTSAWMATLRALTGRVAFDAAMKTYAERFRFAHPTGADLEAALLEGLGAHVVLSEPTAGQPPVTLDVQQFMDQALRSTAQVDFEVGRIDVVPRVSDPPAGYHRDAAGTLHGEDTYDRPSADALDALPDEAVESIVVIRRRGGFVTPVVIELNTETTQQRIIWDGRARATSVRLPGVRVRSVVIDPDGALYLEGRRLDNVAFGRGVRAQRSLSDALGEVTQAMALSVMGAFGP